MVANESLESPREGVPRATARLAIDRLADAPKACLPGPTVRSVSRPFDVGVSPVHALRQLRAFRPALLESRTSHPGARHTVLALRPRVELVAGAYHLEEQDPAGSAQLVAGPPWERLTDWLESYRFERPTPLPFDGGWVGFLSHEASQWTLNTPEVVPRPPARPEAPWAHFRLYPDAIVWDHVAKSATAIANDFGDEPDPAERRLDEYRRLLRAPPHATAELPRTRNEPVGTMTAAEFQARVEQLGELIRAGDCFQANLTASFAYPWEAAPSFDELVSLYDSYAAANPGPWGGFYDLPGLSILSSSPELLADLDADRLRLRPIAGTRPRGSTPLDDERLAEELRTDPKEQSEHAMLVDLARNDAAALCRPGTVHVPDLEGVEKYRHVQHLVSQVEGAPRDDVTVRQLLEAVFPGGTVTGCPKRRAVRRIAELEGTPRGAYTGSLGYVAFNGRAQWNLLIRTLTATPTHLVAHAGCGIVEGSRPGAEWQELEAKARAQVDAALGRSTPAQAGDRCGAVEPGKGWAQALPGRSGEGRRVLLVDFEDSFVHNLADACERLGAETLVWSAHAPVEPAWYRPPTHLILSPGPGHPEDFPTVRHHLIRAERAKVPVLGVCLGHQALGQLIGGDVVRHSETVHGRGSRIRLTQQGRTDPVLGGWGGAVGARYHSLVVRDVPPELEPLATLEDGTIMAMRHRGRPVWGLQFHPESILTERGLDLVQAFLEVDPHG